MVFVEILIKILKQGKHFAHNFPLGAKIANDNPKRTNVSKQVYLFLEKKQRIIPLILSLLMEKRTLLSKKAVLRAAFRANLLVILGILYVASFGQVYATQAKETHDFTTSVVATILSAGEGVVSFGNSGDLRTRRFAKASEKLYVFDKIVLEKEESTLVIRTIDGWTISLRGKGFLNFLDRSIQTGGMKIVVDSHQLLADPIDMHYSGTGVEWLHVIMPFGTLQNKGAKMYIRNDFSHKIDRRGHRSLWEIVVLPNLQEKEKSLVLVQTDAGDTWASGPMSRVLIDKGMPPPAQEPIRMVDYQEDLELMSRAFRAKAQQ